MWSRGPRESWLSSGWGLDALTDEFGESLEDHPVAAEVGTNGCLNLLRGDAFYGFHFRSHAVGVLVHSGTAGQQELSAGQQLLTASDDSSPNFSACMKQPFHKLDVPVCHRPVQGCTTPSIIMSPS